jgi:hypothetical protein
MFASPFLRDRCPDPIHLITFSAQNGGRVRGVENNPGVMMRIFLSWSGAQSRQVAEAFNEWLPGMFPGAEPFFSPDIDKGSRWDDELTHALSGTSVGLVCLTRENLKSEWIHYEVGALYKLPGALVWTFLLGISHADVAPPLAKFQHTTTRKPDVWKLVKTINNRLREAGAPPWQEANLRELFEIRWPYLDKRLAAALASTGEADGDSVPRAPIRDSEEVLGEVLERLRSLDRHFAKDETVGDEPDLAGAGRDGDVLTIIDATLWNGVRLDVDPGQPEVQKFIKYVKQVLPDVTVTRPKAAKGEPPRLFLTRPETPSRIFGETIRKALLAAELSGVHWSGIPSVSE